MQNVINYQLHKTYTPPYYHRQYEHDLPQDSKKTSKLETTKRAVHLAIPFLSLYQPFGQIISLSMGTTRLFTNSTAVFSASSATEGAYSVMQVGLAGIALAGSFYQFTLGLYLTTLFDLLSNILEGIDQLSKQEYKKAGEESLQALSSILYLGIMITGSLEVILFSILIQATVSFYQSREEWKNGQVPEALAKSLMGMIRLYQIKGQVYLIQRRNFLTHQYKDLSDRLQNGKEIDHLWDHPLIKELENIQADEDPLKDRNPNQILNGSIPNVKAPNALLKKPAAHPLENLPKVIEENNVTFNNGNGGNFNFGAHFYGYGKQLVKGMNVSFKKEGENTTLDFKINHVFRNRLQTFISQMETASQEDLQDLFKIFGSKVKNISIELIQENKDSSNLGNKYQITLQGLGKIFVGASNDVLTLYDRVSVQMDKGKNFYDFHEALSILNLEDALRQSAKEDIERMKLGYLFRLFNPKEATCFERSEAFFNFPLKDFKAEIFKLDPSMKGLVAKWLPKMKLHEILPGKMRWSLPGLGDELKKKGLIGLAVTMTGAWNQEERFQRVASILSMGMLSSEQRWKNGINKTGLSSTMDFYTGGADSVFTQIVTKNNTSFGDYNYDGEIRFLISPDILDTITYQYNYDSYGNRDINHAYWVENYLDRPNIFEFLQKQMVWFNGGNEVMVKDRIPPNYFTGIVVQNQYTKNELLNYLRKINLVQKNEFGIETIYSKPVNEFIHVGNSISEQFFI